MGASAKFIITGDATQVDLPRNQPSGLIQALRIVKNIQGIQVIILDGNDVIRHRLVKEIVSKYDVEKEHLLKQQNKEREYKPKTNTNQ